VHHRFWRGITCGEELPELKPPRHWVGVLVIGCLACSLTTDHCPLFTSTFYFPLPTFHLKPSPQWACGFDSEKAENALDQHFDVGA